MSELNLKDFINDDELYIKKKKISNNRKNIPLSK